MAWSRADSVLYLDALGALGNLPGDFSPGLLESLLTISGGETITDEEWSASH
jgi:hypothetical protein